MAAAKSGLASLPEDVLHDVFSRLRIKDLFLLAVTSRWWLRLFTDPAFFHRGLLLGQQQQQGARLLGFFFQGKACEMLLVNERRASAFAPTFFPTPWSPLAGPPTDRALTSFIADDDGDFNYAEPLASRNGIVLMRIPPRHRGEVVVPVFGICNPVTGERHITTPFRRGHCGGVQLFGYAIVTAADIGGEQQPLYSSRRHVFSQLLVITSNGGDVHSYSAATRSWTARLHSKRNDYNGRFSSEEGQSAVIHRGAAHWLYMYHEYGLGCQLLSEAAYILSAEVAGAERVSLAKLPLAVGQAQASLLFVNRDGKLSIASVYGMHVQVWTQQQQDGDASSSSPPWLRTRLFPIPPTAGIAPDTFVSGRRWFQFNGGALLVLFIRAPIPVFLLNLDKLVVEKLIDLPFHSPRMKVVPYEMDLAEFFTFHLGGLACCSREQLTCT